MSPNGSEHDPAGYIELIRGNADFRFLWFGQIVSLLGDWFTFIASAALVSKLTGSGVAVGILFVVRMIAPFLVSPLGGVASDRYNRKRLLILTDLVRAMIVLGFFFVRTPGQAWLLYVLTGTQLAVSGFFFPARNAILPSIVAARELGAANALGSVTWSVMLALGTALGGLVAGSIGVYAAYGIDACSFVLSALFIARIKYAPSVEAGRCAPSSEAPLRQYMEGLRFIRRRLNVLALVLHKGAVTLTTSGGLQVIQVALAQNVFVMGTGGGVSMGLMFAVVGVGTGVGPIVARRFTGDEPRLLAASIALSYLMMAVGVGIAATLSSFGALLCGLFLRGAGSGIIWVFSTQLLMHLLPSRIRGRVFATDFALFTLMSAAGAALSGWGIDSPGMGIRATLWAMAFGALVPGLIWTMGMRLIDLNQKALDDDPSCDDPYRKDRLE